MLLVEREVDTVAVTDLSAVATAISTLRAIARFACAADHTTFAAVVGVDVEDDARSRAERFVRRANDWAARSLRRG